MNQSPYYDAVVIGGGFFGCNLALYLKQQLNSVVILTGSGFMTTGFLGESGTSPQWLSLSSEFIDSAAIRLTPRDPIASQFSAIYC